MHEIKCPKCGEVFQVDESGYAELLSQVRNEAFEDELQPGSWKRRIRMTSRWPGWSRRKTIMLL